MTGIKEEISAKLQLTMPLPVEVLRTVRILSVYCQVNHKGWDRFQSAEIMSEQPFFWWSGDTQGTPAAISALSKQDWTQGRSRTGRSPRGRAQKCKVTPKQCTLGKIWSSDHHTLVLSADSLKSVSLLHSSVPLLPPKPVNLVFVQMNYSKQKHWLIWAKLH